MKQTVMLYVAFFLILNHAIENGVCLNNTTVSPSTNVSAPKTSMSSNMLSITTSTAYTSNDTGNATLMPTSSLRVQSVSPMTVDSVSPTTVKSVSSMAPPPGTSAVRNTTFTSLTPSTAMPLPSSSTSVPPTKPTQKPKPQPGPKDDHERHFDTASFFGGIILASGLFVCGYFIWRFYKNRRSYHHL